VASDPGGVGEPVVVGSSATTDVHGLATVSLHRSHELDFAVMVPVVVPIHKCTRPTDESNSDIIDTSRAAPATL
jgi:hypothetical protein